MIGVTILFPHPRPGSTVEERVPVRRDFESVDEALGHLRDALFSPAAAGWRLVVLANGIPASRLVELPPEGDDG